MMISDSDIVYWVWLSQILGAGNADVEYVISKFKSPKDLYDFGKTKGFENIKFLSDQVINKMRNVTIDKAIDIVENCKIHGYEIITIADIKYPHRLRNIYSSPILLYVNGNIDNIDDILSIAIVGARKCTDYAKDVTKIFAKQLALRGVTIISGMAIGVDGIALEEALANGGRVIAVLGCGLDVNYPLQNFSLKKQIEDSPNGCIISEYPPGTKPFASNFPVRNRIMSGLSVGVLVVEAGEKSGSLITAKIAIEQGKDVYGVPNNIFCKNNIGTINLLKEGALIASNPNDIINPYIWKYKLSLIRPDNDSDLNIEKYNQSVSNLMTNDLYNKGYLANKVSEKKYNLDGILKTIYELLEYEGPKSADYVSEKLNVAINEILINFTELELMGAIKIYQGMKYGIT